MKSINIISKLFNLFNLKNIIIIVFALMLACCSQKNDIPKSVYVDFMMNNESNENGIPNDSATSYFPEKLFTDTIACYINSFGRIRDSRYLNEEQNVRTNEGSIEKLRDTFEIVTDSSHYRGISYMLFKMNEPVLSNHFLDKSVYRLIALRSFDLPLVIRIEKKGNDISISSKKLNRHITYPFFEMMEFVMFDPPRKKNAQQKKEFEEQYQIAKRENDSLRAAVNNTNYYLILDDKKKNNIAAWDSLEILVDSAKFWKTKPDLSLNHLQIDGSNWIFEGHFQSGYQIKKIPCPHFSPRWWSNIYDENDCYADIFRFLIEKAGLKNENLY